VFSITPKPTYSTTHHVSFELLDKVIKWIISMIKASSISIAYKPTSLRKDWFLELMRSVEFSLHLLHLSFHLSKCTQYTKWTPFKWIHWLVVLRPICWLSNKTRLLLIVIRILSIVRLFIYRQIVIVFLIIIEVKVVLTRIIFNFLNNILTFSVEEASFLHDANYHHDYDYRLHHLKSLHYYYLSLQIFLP
jgi:hypothetical protein